MTRRAIRDGMGPSGIGAEIGLDAEGEAVFSSSRRGIEAGLRQVHRLYIRLLQEHLAKRGLSVAQYLHLRILWETDGLAQNEISHRLGIEKASSTGVLDALEADGLIQRVRDTADRRRLLVFLSPKGHALRDTILPFAHQVAEVAGQKVPQQDLAAFFRTIDRMIINLDQALGRRSRQKQLSGARSTKPLHRQQ